MQNGTSLWLPLTGHGTSAAHNSVSDGFSSINISFIHFPILLACEDIEAASGPLRGEMIEWHRQNADCNSLKIDHPSRSLPMSR